MNNENKTIHEFDFNLICEFFSSMERQGPGSSEVTLKALSFIDNLNEKSLIADIGCGTGGQTLTLANHTKGKITALDLFPDFVNILNRNIEQVGLQDRVKGIVGSMDNEYKNIRILLLNFFAALLIFSSCSDFPIPLQFKHQKVSW